MTAETKLKSRTYSICGKHFYPNRETMKALLDDKNSMFRNNHDEEYWVKTALDLRAILEDLVKEDKSKNNPYILELNGLRDKKARLAFSNEQLETEVKELRKQVDVIKIMKEIIIELKTFKDVK